MTIRREYSMRGVVQGVGFRPHVAVIAAQYDITGFCGNDDAQVFIEAQGSTETVTDFIEEVLANLPPLAQVLTTTHRELPLVSDEKGFTIVASKKLSGARTLIPPDVATCPDCLSELADVNDRRHGYPFITCTNCGPRLSIIEDLPYDRPATTMRVFEMCPACRAEYQNPADRRYHAQPISCFDCGPHLWLTRENATPPATIPSPPAVLDEARQRLAEGEILAVKGLGGFHLVCAARNETAVSRLRERKRRSGKPFAVLVPDLETARHLAILDDQQERLLASPARPIVIAPMTAGYDLAPSVAPGLTDVGLLLPYTPLHTLLTDQPLVATSGNLSDEPLCYTNAEALTRLAHLADAFLLHDREIHVPVEDSVFLESVPTRRSRGYAPLPIPVPNGRTLLAVGGEIKNTFTLANQDLAFVSAHIGDMGSLAAQQAFSAAVAQQLTIQKVEPEIVVCDLHPDYATTSWAERYCADHQVPLLRVQHHYAHALALAAEYGLTSGPFVVAALDGTGFGTDGTIWGGEILTLGETLAEWQRTWHVPLFPLVGGDRAAKEPWRVAVGLATAWGLDISGLRLGEPAARALVESQLASGFGVVQTSSLGRVFDAVAAILGICSTTTYEAQAAMELERVAASWVKTSSAGRPSWNHSRTLPELVTEVLSSRRSVAERAYQFHAGLAAILAQELAAAAAQAETQLVGLTGGCALNRLFRRALVAELEGRGLPVLTHRIVPPNDGGLSLGQALAGRLVS